MLAMRVPLSLLLPLALSQTSRELQIAGGDVDKDGDMDVVSGGKSGLFLAENAGTGVRGSSR